jgi:hypothetical protein
MPTSANQLAKSETYAHVLFLDKAWASSPIWANGGDAIAEVFEEKSGSSTGIRKYVTGVRFTPIEMECGPDLSPSFYLWLSAALEGTFLRKAGSVVHLDEQMRPASEIAFASAIVGRVGLPAVDATSENPARLTVQLIPEQTGRIAGVGPLKSSGPQTSPRRWRTSDFSLKIDGIECKDVIRIEALEATAVIEESPMGEQREYAKQPVHLRTPDLIVTLPESSAQPFFAWHEDFVIKGNNSPAYEKNGSLEFLESDRKGVAFKVAFKGLGIRKVARQRPESSPTQTGTTTGRSQPLVTAWMYSQEMHFVSAAPVATQAVDDGAADDVPIVVTGAPAGATGSFAPTGATGFLAAAGAAPALPTAGEGAVMQVESSPRQFTQLRRGVAERETPASVPPDPFNNTFASARSIGTIGCGQSVSVQGTTSPAGTEDWLQVSVAENCPLQVKLTADPGIKFDIVDAGHTNLYMGVASAQVLSRNPFWIRVFGAPTVTGSWTLNISNP